MRNTRVIEWLWALLFGYLAAWLLWGCVTITIP